VIALLGAPAAASSVQDSSWSVFTGKFTEDRLFEEILTFTHSINFDEAWVTVLNYNRVLAHPSPRRRWEGELQFGVHHSGVQDHFEVNSAIIHRWSDWPWDGLLRTSLAAGTGFSLASDVPVLEREGRPGEDAQRFLLYLMFEFEVAPHWARRWSIYARIHHRSGVFGAFGGVHGGSDHIGLGFRWFTG
jgi:hypothetical protein